MKAGYPYIFSNSVEIFEAQFNTIHHNRSENDRVFSELGGSANNKASDNSFEFNLHTSNVAGARFITTRGALNTEFGPVYRTTAVRNTVYFTGPGSQGLSCGMGCTPSILSASYNIIDVVEKAIYFDGTMGQTSNIVWSHGAPVKVQDGSNLRVAPIGTTPQMIVGDPRFVDTAAANFRLSASSPAIGSGGPAGYTTDLQGDNVNSLIPDIGAYQFSS